MQEKINDRTMNQRNINFDFLRVIASIAVVWLHVSSTVVIKNPDVHGLTWWVGSFANAFSRWCVPLFVMVSGALLLSESSNDAVSVFYKKRAVPVVFDGTRIHLHL